eukprot:PhM_4_TR8319/c1_g1_i1/m.77672
MVGIEEFRRIFLVVVLVLSAFVWGYMTGNSDVASVGIPAIPLASPQQHSPILQHHDSNYGDQIHNNNSINIDTFTPYPINWTYKKMLPPRTVFHRLPIRVVPSHGPNNMSRTLQLLCHNVTPCPYALPIRVMRSDDPWRRTARVCTGADLYEEPRPGTWHYDGETLPRGVEDVSTEYVMSRPLMYVPSSGCRMRRLGAAALNACMRKRGTAVFVGDSHTRETFLTMVHMLGWPQNVGRFEALYFPWHFRRNGVKMMFCPGTNKVFPSDTSDIFIGLGIWAISRSKYGLRQSLQDYYLLYYWRLKQMLTHVLRSRARWPRRAEPLTPLKVTIVDIRHMYESSDQRKNHDWTMWLFSRSQTGHRVSIIRKMQRCVARRVLRELGLPFRTISYRHGLTKTSLAHALVFPDGHHYRRADIIASVMADIVIHRICSSAYDVGAVPTASDVAAACNIPPLCRNDTMNSKCPHNYPPTINGKKKKPSSLRSCRQHTAFVRDLMRHFYNVRKLTKEGRGAEADDAEALFAPRVEEYKTSIDRPTGFDCLDLRKQSNNDNNNKNNNSNNETNKAELTSAEVEMP